MQKLWRTLWNSYLPVLFFLTIGSQAQAQVFRDIHNAQSIDWINAAKYLGLPYGSTPDLNSSRLSPGALFFNTTDSTIYNWTGTQWVKAGGSKTVLLGYLLNKDTLGGFERINVDSLKLDSLLNAISGGTGGAGAVYAGSGLENLNDSTLKLADSVRANLYSSLAAKASQAALNDSAAAIRADFPTGVSSGTTTYQIQTASGGTTFTFTSVPASYSDYIIFVNGSKIRSTTDYTTSGNVITISTIISGDTVEYQRIK